MINNAVLVYQVQADDRIVSIETRYSAITGDVAEIFYGILPYDGTGD